MWNHFIRVLDLMCATAKLYLVLVFYNFHANSLYSLYKQSITIYDTHQQK